MPPEDEKANADWVGGSDENLAEGGDSAASPTKAKLRKDLWALIKESKDREKRGNEGTSVVVHGTTLFVVGSKSAGKTSLILRFLDRDETPSPTVALEYTFGRRTRGVNSTKDVTHIWELAGGVFLSDLLDIPITEANIHASTFIIVLDLSDPSNILETLDTLLGKIRARVAKILAGLEQRGSKRPKALRNYAAKKYGSDHPDKDVVNIMPVPVAIIGSKFDEIKDMESEMRKMLCKTLRYVAHMNGASLLFVSQKDENLVAKSRQLLSHYAFRGSSIKTMTIDHSKPIVMMAGQDTFSGIGLPPSELAKDAVGRQPFVPYERWKADYEQYFPPQKVQKTLERVDLSKFPEPAVDSMRLQKDEELEKMRRANERRLKDKDAVGGVPGLAMGNIGKEKKKGKAYSRAK
nr:Cytoplasmic dynein 2 light intermediate chain 1 [Polyrhizophydium stewartii]